ncbi:hypothetical protein C7H19_06740 [Aphanothece hegewaldii CCALA 016]|uniref:Glycosyltransferase 61 catalytic domain-containing protein n=1 Tax=Aphanothece hegewaldii CCALA 016 TaxID=2107694 RepID=A0A2T1M0G2_9CHRO|nr:glycosyltransferase family 61 protein [Aphanothece hegewaldii]PSF38163.1 hypothetical protein C7H19_06740 [Aphanothece hegewaldii CCALA 016]
MSSELKNKPILFLLSKIRNKILITLYYIYAKNSKSLFVSRKVKKNLFNLPKNLKYQNSPLKSDETILKTSSSLVVGKWGGRNPAFYHYDSSVLDYYSNSIKLYQGTPLEESKTFQNVIYFPEYRCFYLKDGSRIDYSCIPEYRIAPEKIQIPNNLKKVNHKFIYGGHLFRHYGHLITECICRLWYAAKEQNYPIIYSESPRFSVKRDYVDIFMNTIGFDKSRFFAFDEPILLEEVIIPYPSFTMNYHAHSVHRLLPEAVAQAILKEPPKKIAQPLYMSRKNLNKTNSFRSLINEEKLEDILREKNFNIVYPEQLNLTEQIQLVNQHEVIIGVCGSALHTILFDLSNSHLVCLGDLDYIHPNFLLVDAIKSKDSTYIAALELEQNTPEERPKKTRILNLENAVSALKSMGLL